MPSVSEFNKSRVIALMQTGRSCRQIQEMLGIPKSTIHCIIQKWRQTQIIERRPGSGRSRISTVEQDEALVDVLLNHPFKNAVNARIISNFPGSISTARNRIRVSNVKNYAAAKKVGLTPQHKEARVAFALEHLARDDDFWRRVVFSDEKVFQSSHNGHIRVYRPRNSRYHERYIASTERSGRFSVNLWGWISAVSPGVTVNVENRLNSDVYVRILEHIMLPSVRGVYRNDNFIFQHDNCTVHTARRTVEWLQAQNINVLDWPSRSPDINPIENLWGLLQKKLQSRRVIFHNREELLTAIMEEWHTIPQDYFRNICLSMPRRLENVIAANGAMTKY